MSGIFGIVHHDGRRVDKASLVAMRGCMAHRGPDGSRLWYGGPAGMGQLMLHSTPESLQETLPWEDSESGLVITADARIDNRAELAAALAARGQGLPDSSPDSRFILEAFKCWGEGCVDRLLGDFAFAIWDERRRRLFCARDHMGIRPLFYYATDSVFVFASSALGVVASGLTPDQINPVRIADYLVPGMEGADKVSSFFRDVWRCPPAHTMRVAGPRVRKAEYWAPDAVTERKFDSDEECTEAYHEVLSAAVNARLRCHRPLASMLSGGLDSATIVALARERLERQGAPPLAVFSGVSEDETDCIESRCSRLVTEQGGLDATRLRPSDVEGFRARIDSVESRLEEPFESGWILHQMIYFLARENGHVAVMDGIDGDGVASLTSGYPVFLLRARQFATAHREILGSWRHLYRESIPLWLRYVRVARASVMPAAARRMRNRLAPPLGNWRDDGCFVAPDLARDLDVDGRNRRYLEQCNLMLAKSLRKAHVKRLSAPYLAAGIERYGRLAAACGVEQRQPLLDRRVVEFCVSLPWQYKVRDGWSKYGMRRVAEHLLPQEVAWRTGRDTLLVSFWRAWGVLEQERLGLLAVRLAGRPHPWLNNEKFIAATNQYKMGDHDVRVALWQTVNLLEWLDRTNSYEETYERQRNKRKAR